MRDGEAFLEEMDRQGFHEQRAPSVHDIRRVIVEAVHKKFLVALARIYKVHRSDVLLSARTEDVLKAHVEMFPDEAAEINAAWKIVREKFLRTNSLDTQEPNGDIFDDVLNDLSDENHH